MGKVLTEFKVWNFENEILAKRGLIKEREIRSYKGEGLVDTGATLLVLLEEIVEQLGLTIHRESVVTYANGRVDKKRIARGILGRVAEVECIVENRGVKPLIGQVPLEVMDLHVDCKLGKLVPRPGFEDTPLIELYYYGAKTAKEEKR